MVYEHKRQNVNIHLQSFIDSIVMYACYFLTRLINYLRRRKSRGSQSSVAKSANSVPDDGLNFSAIRLDDDNSVVAGIGDENPFPGVIGAKLSGIF